MDSIDAIDVTNILAGFNESKFRLLFFVEPTFVGEWALGITIADACLLRTGLHGAVTLTLL